MNVTAYAQRIAKNHQLCSGHRDMGGRRVPCAYLCPCLNICNDCHHNHLQYQDTRTERVGFNLALFCNLSKALYLRLKVNGDKDFQRLIDVLFLHGFLLFRDPF